MYDKVIVLCNSLLNGYQYFCDSSHPLAYENGAVYYHRHVVSIREGRWLGPDEHVHHKDENRLNNSPENLEILTPEEHLRCHSLDGRGFPAKKHFYKCKRCPKVYCSNSTGNKYFCSDKCSKLASRKFEITKDELEKLVWQYPTTKVAKIFGVSDKAIEKRCRLLGVEKPPRGYWSSKK